jgi:hypothetical protein
MVGWLHYFGPVRKQNIIAARKGREKKRGEEKREEERPGIRYTLQ